MNKTNIEWTDFSANPLKYKRKSDGKVVWACVKTSPGCANCYSEATALRWERGKLFTAANMEEVEPFVCEKETRSMLNAKMVDGFAVSGSRCFVGDMTDIFGEWVPFDLLDRIFSVFAARRDVTWQVLTKRAERMAAYFAENDGLTTPLRIEHQAQVMQGKSEDAAWAQGLLKWPLSNVWLGVSVENQKLADERIPHLLKTPAAVRFLSCEPLLGAVDLDPWINPARMWDGDPRTSSAKMHAFCWKLGWVIVGGESGHGARPMNVDWARSLVQQCKAAAVPVFVKQLGAVVASPNDTVAVWFDECGHLQCEFERPRFQGEVERVVGFKNKKGGDPAEWPEDLRVREFPK